MKPKADSFARELTGRTVDSVRSASAAKVSSRRAMLSKSFEDPESARTRAAQIKGFVLDNLPELLERFEAAATGNGIVVHWATHAESARNKILDICRRHAGNIGQPHLTIVKGKSMATEEIHLNDAISQEGHEVIETDLGEFVVQIDGDTPSHIVTPIIHKDRKQVSESFLREGLGPKSEDPAELAHQAREHLRRKFREAHVGISGVNFALADSGTLVIVENEGNNRLSTTAPKVHIAVMGLEKLLPTAADLPLFLKLLAASATGQRTTVYTHMIRGPRREDEPDGPDEVHVVILDNGRSRILGSRYRDILRCIRCGACLNVCPVYRQISGHGYRHTYSGPLGAVLAPALEGVATMGDLAKASSLCGACEEVCPVKIPIPDLLLKLREEGVRKGADDGMRWSMFAYGANSSFRWRAGLTMLPVFGGASPRGWAEFREAPRVQGRNFREWWGQR